MKSNLVRDWMTPDPITISSRVTLPEAHWLMIENNIRRLPVVDGGVLVGIVTREDLRRVEPVSTFGLDMICISDMLAKLPIRQVMVTHPMTIAPTDTLLHAASLMLEHKISALPVMDGDKLTGIITESDIFRVLIAREKELAIPLTAIGHVENQFNDPVSASEIRTEESKIVLNPNISDGLQGIELGQQIMVIYYFHRSEGFDLLQHPRGDQSRPKRGVFTLRSPRRPNPIGVTVVEVVSIENHVLRVMGLDAIDGSPILDIKPVN